MSDIHPHPEIKLAHSPAAERNKDAILERLREILRGDEQILEIGSGTGQHAVHFCKAMPDLVWQASELPERVAITNAVIASANLPNLKPAIAIDAVYAMWPLEDLEVVYTANTAHIMSWETAQKMVVNAAEHLKRHGRFIIYGPFKYEGEFTSESNRMFDESLKRNDREQGIRDFEGIERVANKYGLYIENDFSMPANNRLLVFTKV